MPSYHTVYEDAGVVIGREYERRRKVREAISRIPILGRRIILEYIEGSSGGGGDTTRSSIVRHVEGCGEVVLSAQGKPTSLKIQGVRPHCVPLSHVKFLGIAKVSGDA